MREALFSSLGDLSNVRVLDLYAAAGALGIEALSRGARCAVFVESARDCVAALRANLADLGLAGVARVLPCDAAAALRRLGSEGERFDLVLMDPPYESDEASRALAALVGSGVLEPEALVVVEGSRRHALAVTPGLALLGQKRYGDTLVSRLAPERPESTHGGSPGP